MDTVLDKINSVFQQVSDSSGDDLRRKDPFPLINSMEYIKIIVMLEECFDIEFEDDHLNFRDYQTVGDICEYVENLAEEQMDSV